MRFPNASEGVAGLLQSHSLLGSHKHVPDPYSASFHADSKKPLEMSSNGFSHTQKRSTGLNFGGFQPQSDTVTQYYNKRNTFATISEDKKNALNYNDNRAIVNYHKKMQHQSTAPWSGGFALAKERSASAAVYANQFRR